MGDRYDISVDVGEGRDWWCVYGLTTHNKVYELNKQMCDIGKTMNDPFEPISEEASQDITKVLERMRNPKEYIMEEKKTKKMTKAEAFEYFKGKRVACDNFNCVAIQRKFFEVGVKWRGGSTDATKDRGNFLFVDLNGCLTHCNSRAWFDAHAYEKISVDDILSIEIVEEKKPSQEFVPYELTEMGKVQSTLDDGEVLIITRKQILKIQL